jgi:hypothetical protein
MKLSILTMNNNLNNNNTTATTNGANPNIDLKESKIKSLHRKFIKSSNANENKMRKNVKKRVKKFSKLNEENRISSAYSISNFSSISYNNNNVKKLKCLLVGDPLVGKTTLIWLFLKRLFQTDYQPTIVDNYEGFYSYLIHNAYLFKKTYSFKYLYLSLFVILVKVNLNGDSYTLNLFDTAGQVT